MGLLKLRLENVRLCVCACVYEVISKHDTFSGVRGVCLFMTELWRSCNRVFSCLWLCEIEGEGHGRCLCACQEEVVHFLLIESATLKNYIRASFHR